MNGDTPMKHMVSIIMPALNEAECIEVVVAGIPVQKLATQGLATEVLVVDNGSDDGTGELARKAGARVVRETQRGYGHAYLKGFREAKGDIICTLDADGTYPAYVLPELVNKLLEDKLDFISTDRFSLMTNGVMSKKNKMGNAILSLLGRILFQLPFRDSQSGMWVFKSELLDKMQLHSEGMELSQNIKIEAACRLKAACAEIPIYYNYRYGMPKLRVWHDGFGNLMHLVRKRFNGNHHHAAVN